MEKTKSLRTIKWVLPLLVAVFGVGVVFAVSGEKRGAVTAKSSVVDERWFIYNGQNPQDDADNYSEWVPQGEETEPGCDGQEALCAIKVDISGGSNTSALDDMDIQAFIATHDTDANNVLDGDDYDPSNAFLKFHE